MLEEKLDNEKATRVNIAHERLPALFKKIKTDTTIIYPFKYYCITGKYVYEEIEKKLPKKYITRKWKSKSYRICHASPWPIPKDLY
jgi:hypothetical protein